MRTNWKRAAKFFRQQFLLWVETYNQLADIYMIDESWSSGGDAVVVYKTWRANANPDH